MALLEIFLTVITLPLLLTITMVNTEYIFQGNIFQIYVLIYVLYFLISAIGLLLFKRLKFKNGIIKQERYSTFQFLFHTCILVLPAVIMVHYFILSTLGGTGLYLRAYGKVAFLYLVFALSISPLTTFIKNKKISDTLIQFRKIIGILSFVFFLKHGLEYFSMEYLFAIKHTPVIGYRNYVWQNFLVRRDASTGVVAGVLLFFLGITSNRFSVKVLSGSLWKKVQSLVYPAFLVAAIHVAFASRFDVFYIFLTIWLVCIRSASYLATKDKPTSGPTTKYICIPCGYIYDEAVGDPDGGLEPGTKFDDIPDSRVCPICGVTKSSFEPYYETPQAVFSGYIAQIIGYMMLTKDVLEITLKVDSALDISPGQYVLLMMKDFDGEFTRAYSIVENSGDTIKLGIKVQDTGRGGRLLKKLKIGDVLKIKGVYGNFVLKNTPNPKVFIATGTGFSPIYNMIIRNTFSTENTLLRGFSTKEDIYYMDQLHAVKNLKMEIYISKEQVEGCHFGRIDTSAYEFSPDTEFYICGVPSMVVEQIKLLKVRGYKNVYSEAF